MILGKPEVAAEIFERDKSLPVAWQLEKLGQTDSGHWIGDRLETLRRSGAEPPRGPWPSPRSDQQGGLSNVRDVLGARGFHRQVVVAFIPVTEPALIPLFLGFGDWNDCPSAVVHAAMARRWGHLHGAAPVAFGSDTIEYRVARPVSTHEAAVELALEHFAYCPDSVLQGTETIERLAASLINAKYWLFWWDRRRLSPYNRRSFRH